MELFEEWQLWLERERGQGRRDRDGNGGPGSRGGGGGGGHGGPGGAGSGHGVSSGASTSAINVSHFFLKEISNFHSEKTALKLHYITFYTHLC